MTDDREVLRTYLASVEAAHADLTRMDRLAGDGDFGDNLRSGLRQVAARLDDDPSLGALDAAASVFLDEVGGTSGPLFGLLFSELARACAGTDDVVAGWGDGVAAGLAAIQRVGEAEPGDRTLVDALAPAAQGFSQGTLSAAAAAAAAGARATSGLRARRGRASYVGDRSLGVPDPGAVGVAMLLVAAAQVLEPAAAQSLPSTAELTAV